MVSREQWAAWHGEFAGPLSWIEARFGGTCRGCGLRYEVGELIAYDEDEGGWICWDCGQS